jgi:hypothetical protein
MLEPSQDSSQDILSPDSKIPRMKLYMFVNWLMGFSHYITCDYILAVCIFESFFIINKRPTPASHGCYADTKVFIYYIAHVIYL